MCRFRAMRRGGDDGAEDGAVKCPRARNRPRPFVRDSRKGAIIFYIPRYTFANMCHVRRITNVCASGLYGYDRATGRGYSTRRQELAVSSPYCRAPKSNTINRTI